MAKTAVAQRPSHDNFEIRVNADAPEIFDSLDSLKVASNTLLPPFKTVRVKNEPLLPKFKEKPANKVYTQT